MIVAVADLDSMFDPVPGAVVVWLLTVVAAAAFLAFRFYRDPERHPPERADVVVSPADGEVIYVRSAAEGELPVSTKEGRPYTLEELTRTPLENTDAIVVGISLSLLDVHVNRAPIGGTVISNHHHKGSFKSLGKLESLFENERATTVIERDGVPGRDRADRFTPRPADRQLREGRTAGRVRRSDRRDPARLAGGRRAAGREVHGGAGRRRRTGRAGESVVADPVVRADEDRTRPTPVGRIRVTTDSAAQQLRS